MLKVTLNNELKYCKALQRGCFWCIADLIRQCWPYNYVKFTIPPGAAKLQFSQHSKNIKATLGRACCSSARACEGLLPAPHAPCPSTAQSCSDGPVFHWECPSQQTKPSPYVVNLVTFPKYQGSEDKKQDFCPKHCDLEEAHVVLTFSNLELSTVFKMLKMPCPEYRDRKKMISSQ